MRAHRPARCVIALMVAGPVTASIVALGFNRAVWFWIGVAIGSPGVLQ